MRTFLYIILINFFLASLPAPVLGGNDTISPDLQALLAEAPGDELVPVIIRLSDQVDFTPFEKEKDRTLRRANLIKALIDRKDASQREILQFLRKNKVREPASFWIFNGIAAELPADLIRALALRADVAAVDLDAEVVVPEVMTASSENAEWNINMTGAPLLWDRGFTGEGVVVGIMDTGVDYFHPDIEPKWRGGTNSWYDPNSEHETPYDADGHGTGVAGIILGGDAGGTAIGVAPGAQWIAVKIFNDSGVATVSRIHQGFQWLLDPDSDPQTDDAADIINGSWYLLNTINQCNTEFSLDIAALKAANIGVVFAAGNFGSSSSTSVSPANDPQSLAIGAVNNTMTVASFSSRGPSACGGDMYPELAAPGASIKTADRTFGGVDPDSYRVVSGTSFAAPHITGVMALLLSAVPDLNIADLEAAMKLTAVDLGVEGIDNASGYGLIDSLRAYLALTVQPTAPVAMDDSYDMTEGSMLIVKEPGVLANDLDANGDHLTAHLEGGASDGALSLFSDGSFRYTPNSGVTTDSFTYTANDGTMDSLPATVTITVNSAAIDDVIDTPQFRRVLYRSRQDHLRLVVRTNSRARDLAMTAEMDQDGDGIFETPLGEMSKVSRRLFRMNLRSFSTEYGLTPTADTVVRVTSSLGGVVTGNAVSR